MLKKLLLSLAFAVATMAPAVAADAPAPPQGIRRVELQRWDIPNTNYVAINFKIEFDPGAGLPFHTHPGLEMTYITEGELTTSSQGAPDKIVKAGEFVKIEPGTVHLGANKSKAVVKGLQTYVVEKDKPLVIPAK